MAELLQLAEKLAQAGAVTGLILVIYGGHRGWWVYGRELLEERSERDRQLDDLRQELLVLRTERNEYKSLLFRTLRVTETAVEAAKSAPPVP